MTLEGCHSFEAEITGTDASENTEQRLKPNLLMRERAILGEGLNEVTALVQAGTKQKII